MVSARKYCSPIVDSVHISPVGSVNDAGGTWRVQMSVSTTDGVIDIMAYVKVARNPRSYAKTMGYYVADFNAYRIK